MIIGKSRQSRVVEGSVVKTEKIGTIEGRKKRTVYHTPAIIETVVEEPDIEMPNRIVQVRQDVVRRGSVVAPRPVTIHPVRNSIATVRRQNTSRFVPQIPAKNGYESRNFGVKVTEDLTAIQPILQDQYHQQGCCQSCYLSTVNCCRLFKCPFWLCCLIPLLFLFALLAGGYWLNKNHTSVLHRNIFGLKNTTNTFTSSILTKQNQQSNKSQIVAPIVQQQTTKKSQLQSQSNQIIPKGNNKKIVTKIVEVDDRTQIIQKDQYQNTKKKTQETAEQTKQQNNEQIQNKEAQNKKQVQNKQIINNESKDNDDKRQQQQVKQDSTVNNSNQNKSQDLNSDEKSDTNTVVNNSQSNKSLPSTKSLISTLLSFNIAPTFQQHWNKTKLHHHLRYFI